MTEISENASPETASGAGASGATAAIVPPAASAVIAAVVLLLLAGLAFDPLRLVQASAAERLTLLFLALCAALAAYSPLRRHFAHADAATFVFTAAWFALYPSTLR